MTPATVERPGVWPPVPYGDAAVLGDGIDGFLLGQTAREDGFLQATYNGHPLYHYSGDSAPGDVNGQGVNDVWFAVDATDRSCRGCGSRR